MPVTEPSPEEICVKLVPPSVLRKTPTLAAVVTSALSTEMTIVLPRLTTPRMFRPVRRPLPSTSTKELPALVEICRPVRGPPNSARLLLRPTPTMSVLPVASVVSNASAPTDNEPSVSVNGVQVGLAAWALIDFHKPPFTAPRYKMAGLEGCGRTRLTAPETSPLTMPSTWPLRTGVGPWAIQRLFVSSAAMALPPELAPAGYCFTVNTVPFSPGAKATSLVPAATGRSSSVIVSVAVLIAPSRVEAEPVGLLNASVTVRFALVAVLS